MLEILASISPTVLKAIGMIVSALIGLAVANCVPKQTRRHCGLDPQSPGHVRNRGDCGSGPQ